MFLMNARVSDGRMDEPRPVKVPRNLTGNAESGASNIQMCACARGRATSQSPGRTRTKTPPTNQPLRHPATLRLFQLPILFLPLAWLGISAPLAGSAESSPPLRAFVTQPLSLADAVNFSLQQNPKILTAQQDLEAAQGVVIQTRAIAIPKVRATGSYSGVQSTDVESQTLPQGTFSFGAQQSWSSQIRLVQSLYEGGRILSSLRSAKLTKERALLNYQTVVADSVLEVQNAYYDVLLAQQQIIVQEKSVELLRSELADTMRRYEAGTVPRFNVLRAEVELANQQPKLIRARNSLRITKNQLANVLGFNIPRDALEDLPLTLSDKLEAEPYQIDLTQAIATALERRTELGSLRKAQGLRYEDIVNAKATYKPSVQAFGGYEARSSMFTSDLTYDVYGWMAGVQVTWDLFDGLRTKGKVKEAQALYQRAGVELDDTGRRIELEVRTSYSTFMEAKELLESQKKVVERAEEALRLATARSDAGTGTQLEVLSARTALTDAQTTTVQALHDYAAARARLERAMGLNVPSQTPPR
jgi:outer membrane protein TolC